MTGRFERQRAIAEEFGEPFWDVVKGFADMGYSRTQTANILDYGQSSFIRLLDRHGKRHWFRQGQESITAIEAREARKGRATQAQIAAAKVASANNPVYYRIQIDGRTDTLAGHARAMGIPVRTVYNRINRGYSIQQALSKRSYSVVPGTQNHRWRSKWVAV